MTHSLLQHFNPPPPAAQLLAHFTTSEEFTHSHLQHFTPVGNPALTSLYPLRAIDLLILTTFYPPPLWQTSSNFILLPLNNLLTHTYNNLPPSPLTAQLLPHFTPSEQITPSFLNLFTPLPIGRQALTLFCPFSTIYPLTLTSFHPSWQTSSNLILPLLSNWPTHSYNILTPPPPGSTTLSSFYHLWRIYPLTLTTFYPRWQPSSNLIIPPQSNWPTHSYNILPPSTLANQL